MATQGEDVYATLLLNDSYLPGALVLAHSIRDAGTRKKLAVLVTADSISEEVMAELRKLFDYVIPVERVSNQTPANLLLMNRPDLQSTFTKITLWKQVQFRRIVYMDADMVALRAPDELFDIPEPFSAAPDIGWPDLFNTGLMVLTPNMGDYFALLAMAQRGISFDGADQGLLNMHFNNSYNRISFAYNVTPSGHYQYVPAYRHFQSSISAIHFIGPEKPWTQGRDASKGSGPCVEMTGRWWSTYDRHYRESSAVISGQGAPNIIQQLVKGEQQPPVYGYSSSFPVEALREIPISTPGEPVYEKSEVLEDETHTREDKVAGEPPIPLVSRQEKQEKPKQEFSTPFATWNPGREPPPAGSKPEAPNFPTTTHYEMSSDRTPFKAPEKYPEPPKNMYYEVPKTPTYQKPTPIFPWEKDATKPTRVFAEDDEYTRPTSGGSAIADEKDDPTILTTSTVIVAATDPWESFNARTNAWDDIPEIERYIGALQKNRKGNIQVLQGYGTGIPQGSGTSGRRPSVKLTDFPTELERPSLPVTPAPVRRPSFWSGERDEQGKLPAAEGVPAQADWDPVVQLEMLARRQSDVLASRLGNDEAGREIPSRPLPYGSEGVISPTYVPQGPPSHSGTSNAEPKSSTAESKPSSVESKHSNNDSYSSHRESNLSSAESPFSNTGSKSEIVAVMEEPSFTGPSAMFEKGETFPVQERPLGASEEELDALEN